MTRRIRATFAWECDVCIVLRFLSEAPCVGLRKLGCFDKAFSGFGFLCVAGATLPAGIESRRAPRLIHAGSGAALGLISLQVLKRGAGAGAGFLVFFTFNAHAKFCPPRRRRLSTVKAHPPSLMTGRCVCGARNRIWARRNGHRY